MNEDINRQKYDQYDIRIKRIRRKRRFAVVAAFALFLVTFCSVSPINQRGFGEFGARLIYGCAGQNAV